MTDITTTDSARAALAREVEIGGLAARMTDAAYGWYEQESQESDGMAEPNFEAGCRRGLGAYRPAYELAVLIASLGPRRFEPGGIHDLMERAEAALEAAR